MRKLAILILAVCLATVLSVGSAGAIRIGGGGHAKSTKTDTTNFDGALSATENTVQKALDALDDAVGGNPTLTGVTIAGDVTSTATAVDWDLIDDNASALSLDAAGKAGIINIVTSNGAEGVSMSGYLAVTGNAVMKTTAHGSPALDSTETFGAGNSHSVTVVNNFTWAFSNWAASGYEGKKTVYVTNGGAATITWDASIDWEGGVAPVLTASGLDVLVFTTVDGGTTVYGFVAGMDMK